MFITDVIARETLDARGKPTVSCSITLNNGQVVQAHVSLDHDRYECMDVHAALHLINTEIAPQLITKEPCLISMDAAMAGDQPTLMMPKAGNSALLATSLAIAKAQAIVEEVQPYELFAHLCEYETITLPFAMVNLINGGKKHHGTIAIKEFLIMPVGAFNFRTSMEMIQAVFAACEAILHERNNFFGIGEDGGFTLARGSTEEILDLIMESIARAELQDAIAISLDIAADSFYDTQTQRYLIDGKQLTQSEMISWYEQLCSTYPIYALEDPLIMTAYDGWRTLMQQLSQRIQIVADAGCATDPEMIHALVHNELANGCSLTPADIATVTQLLQTIKFAHEIGIAGTLVTHFVDVTDSLMADLCVGTSLGHIKAGGIMRAEAVAHYNRLFTIEDELMEQLLESA